MAERSSAFEVVVPDSIWVTERPIWFGGVRLRSRTTVVRLSGDALWVHSPCTPTDEVCAALDALGEVRWIVVPNRFHHLQAPATAARYPNAFVVGPKSAESRNPDVRLAMGTDDPAYIGSTPELVPSVLDDDGVRFLEGNEYIELEALNDSSDLGPNETYCEHHGPTDSGTYSWDGMIITLSPREGRPRGAKLELDGDRFTLIRPEDGAALLYARLSPTRSRGACP